LPYRVNAIELKVEAQSKLHDSDHELLTRIEERLIAVQKELAKR
jgi:hypothetical protein